MKSLAVLAVGIAASLAFPAVAQHDHHAMQPAPPPAPTSAPAPAPEPQPDHTAMDHAHMDHDAMGREAMEQGDAGDPDMAGMDMSAHAGHGMPAALGPYSADREASGTSWQPDTTTHGGLHAMQGDWMLMAHGVLNAVYDHQSGPRGDDGAFVSGMLMGMAQRPLGNGTLQLRAMLSPDPLMGARGYPLLLASGETANGVDRLVDRQHPHDFVMELAASASHNVGATRSVFVYGGLPGEPAFGPPAFMHREAIMASPEAPITHHWLDSTHISMGVLTAGVVVDNAKLEVSRFNAREPDEHRWNIETGALDSTAVRASWNPIPSLALQASWGRFKDPEQLEPGVDQTRWSASALYARDLSPAWRLAGTMAWGRKTIDHHGERLNDDAYAIEASLKHAGWTFFGRAETAENRELVEASDEHGPAYDVGKVSIGAIRDFRIARNVLLGAGGLVSLNFVPDELGDLYGGRRPSGAMAFVRLKID
jgi:hypothetical protein